MKSPLSRLDGAHFLEPHEPLSNEFPDPNHPQYFADQLLMSFALCLKLMPSAAPYQTDYQLAPHPRMIAKSRRHIASRKLSRNTYLHNPASQRSSLKVRCRTFHSYLHPRVPLPSIRSAPKKHGMDHFYSSDDIPAECRAFRSDLQHASTETSQHPLCPDPALCS
ncbi:hypothetical protein D3C76_867710 [compost metagenome]